MNRNKRLLALKSELSWFLDEFKGAPEVASAKNLVEFIDFVVEPESEYDYEPDQPMSEVGIRVLNSILRARIPEESILRFSEEDLENEP